MFRYKGMETFIIQFNPDKTKGVYGISLVENPAIEEYFVEMSKDFDVQLKEVDAEKRLFMTPVLIPNQKILRQRADGSMYNIMFTEETIRLAQQYHQRNGFQNESTLEHNIDIKLDGVTFIETWMKDDDVHDKSNMKGFKHPIGTWFTIFRVDNDVTLAKIKSGEIKGVSIDGAFEIDENFKLNQTMNTEEKTNFFAELKATILDAFKPAKVEEVKLEEVMPIIEDVKVEDEPKENEAEMLIQKMKDLLADYSVEMAKEVATQLSTFKAELKTEVKEVEQVQLTAPKPNHEIKEAKNLREELFNQMQKHN